MDLCRASSGGNTVRSSGRCSGTAPKTKRPAPGLAALRIGVQEGAVPATLLGCFRSCFLDPGVPRRPLLRLHCRVPDLSQSLTTAPRSVYRIPRASLSVCQRSSQKPGSVWRMYSQIAPSGGGTKTFVTAFGGLHGPLSTRGRRKDSRVSDPVCESYPRMAHPAVPIHT